MNSREERSQELWQFACDLYSCPGVEDACLALQQQQGWNIPLFLFALWSARFGELQTQQIVQAQTLAKDYADNCITPLREIRTRLKSSVLLEEDTAMPGLREQIKALELQGERLLLNRLSLLPDCDQPAISVNAEQLEQQVASLFATEGAGQKNLHLIIVACLSLEQAKLLP